MSNPAPPPLQPKSLIEKTSIQRAFLFQSIRSSEAKDTHRCLSRLDEAWAPLYEEISIEQIQSLLPRLLASIRSMQTICRLLFPRQRSISTCCSHLWRSLSLMAWN